MASASHDMIKIVHEPIDVASILASIADPACGAQCLFIGTTRNNAEGKEVIRLEYDAYEPMALEMITSIAGEAARRWKVHKIAITHRIGPVEIGEASIVIAVASPHRGEAFEACRFCIDTIKRDVPIWKKEFYADGEHWVGLPASAKSL